MDKRATTIDDAANYVRTQTTIKKCCRTRKDRQSMDFIACALRKFNQKHLGTGKYDFIHVPIGKTMKALKSKFESDDATDSE